MDVKSQLSHLDSLLLRGVTTPFPSELTDDEKAAINAYVVLAHAVIEESIEDTFELHFKRLIGWIEAPMVPLETVRLVIAINSWLPDKYKVPYKKRAIRAISVGATKAFRGKVDANNGIKAENISTLAELVGVEWEPFEAALSSELADLSVLGSKRGEAGHLSPYTDRAAAITRRTYPEEVRGWVEDARNAASAIARYLDGLVRAQQPLSLISDWDGN